MWEDNKCCISQLFLFPGKIISTVVSYIGCFIHLKFKNCFVVSKTFPIRFCQFHVKQECFYIFHKMKTLGWMETWLYLAKLKYDYI